MLAQGALADETPRRMCVAISAQVFPRSPLWGCKGEPEHLHSCIGPHRSSARGYGEAGPARAERGRGRIRPHPRRGRASRRPLLRPARRVGLDFVRAAVADDGAGAPPCARCHMHHPRPLLRRLGRLPEPTDVRRAPPQVSTVASGTGFVIAAPCTPCTMSWRDGTQARHNGEDDGRSSNRQRSRSRSRRSCEEVERHVAAEPRSRSRRPLPRPRRLLGRRLSASPAILNAMREENSQRLRRRQVQPC